MGGIACTAASDQIPFAELFGSLTDLNHLPGAAIAQGQGFIEPLHRGMVGAN